MVNDQPASWQNGISVQLGESLLIRADASPQMGTGHLMRCLALGQARKDAGGRVLFITACSQEWLLERLYSAGFIVHRLERPYPDDQDWQVTRELMTEHPDSWLVLDGYHFDSDYQRGAKKGGYRLMVIDDTAHHRHYYADIVLNQNIHAKDLRYSCEPYTRSLLGTKYVLLRREFLKWRGRKRETPTLAQKILVTFGGWASDNVTLKIVAGLRELNVDGLEAMVVLGGNSLSNKGLQSAINDLRFPIRLVTNVTNMADLMAWADVAISAGGSTCWELAFMGLPAVVLVLADNQRPVAEGLHEAGAVVNLGLQKDLSSSRIAEEMSHLLVEPAKRQRMVQCGQQLVDGQGTSRVFKEMRSRTISLRQVSEEDCRLVWQWATDPHVRSVSFLSGPISWEQHDQWFRSKLSDPSCIYYIAVNGSDMPIGQIRYDFNENEAVVSVSVDWRFRGKGYGSAMIRLASQRLFATSDVASIHAYVKRDNETSLQAFVKGGFKNIGVEEVRGDQAIHLVLRKGELL